MERQRQIQSARSRKVFLRETNRTKGRYPTSVVCSLPCFREHRTDLILILNKNWCPDDCFCDWLEVIWGFFFFLEITAQFNRSCIERAQDGSVCDEELDQRVTPNYCLRSAVHADPFPFVGHWRGVTIPHGQQQGREPHIIPCRHNCWWEYRYSVFLDQYENSMTVWLAPYLLERSHSYDISLEHRF